MKKSPAPSRHFGSDCLVWDESSGDSSYFKRKSDFEHVFQPTLVRITPANCDAGS